MHYPCRPENGFLPDPAEVASLITPRTRALVVINPNNPTGAVYPREVLEGLARLAEKHGLMVFSDEIYDGITYENTPFVPIASLVNDTLCATLSGLSKVYRAAGYRVGWVSFSGATQRAAELPGRRGAAEFHAHVQQRARAVHRAQPRSAATRASRIWPARAGGCSNRVAR